MNLGASAALFWVAVLCASYSHAIAFLAPTCVLQQRWQGPHQLSASIPPMRGVGIGCTLLRATDDGSAFPREAGQDEKVARAKALIKKVQSTPKGRRGGEKRAAEQRNTGGGQAEDGVLAGYVVAVTGNFEKTREEVQGRVKDQNAIYSGTVRCVLMCLVHVFSHFPVVVRAVICLYRIPRVRNLVQSRVAVHNDEYNLSCIALLVS